MKRALKYILFTACLIPLAPILARSAEIFLRQFDFEGKDPLHKWSSMVLNGCVDYRIVSDGVNGYVDGFSDKTCSALYYRVGYKLEDYPLLSWRWQALKFPDKSCAATDKEKDDYAARIYVIFPFLSFSSSKFIEYVWDECTPVGTIIESPEGDNIKLIVARNGRAAEGEWRFENRNVLEDYVAAFGKNPNLSVGAIAIMTDGDSTKSQTEAWFDDIIIQGGANAERRL